MLLLIAVECLVRRPAIGSIGHVSASNPLWAISGGGVMWPITTSHYCVQSQYPNYGTGMGCGVKA